MENSVEDLVCENGEQQWKLVLVWRKEKMRKTGCDSVKEAV